MSEKFKTRYTAMQNELNASEALIQRTLSAAHPEKQPRRAPRLRTAALVAAVFMLLLAVTLPVMATTDTGYELLYSISPETAQFFKPINLSDEDQGIRAEVESICLVGDTIQICLALQDLEGGRIDETIELGGNWGVEPYAPAFTKEELCMASAKETFMGFDAESNTARWLLTFSDISAQQIHSSKLLVLSIGRFFSGYTEYLNIELPSIDLAQTDIDPVMTSMPLSGIVSLDTDEIRSLNMYMSETNTDYTFLTPSDEKLSVSETLPEIYITALGYVNNELHIQLYYEDPLLEESHGNLWLQTADGETVQASYSAFSLVKNESGNNIGCYEEFTFDIAQELLSDSTVHANLRTCETVTNGEWRITFPLKETN